MASKQELLVLSPTADEVLNMGFEAYITKHEAKILKAGGVCKVRWPQGLTPRKAGYRNLNMSISSIRQNAVGSRGLYRMVYVETKPMSLDEFKAMAESKDNAPPTTSDGKPLEDTDLERKFWKNVTIRPPLYGADVAGSLFDEKTKGWNLRRLDTLLSTVLEEAGFKLPGVNTPYLYFGQWRSVFAWHTEDLDLYSVNYIHFGAGKQWYVIPPEHRARFESVARSLVPSMFKECSEFLRHKELLLSPQLLDQYQVPYVKVVQHAREMVVVYPGAYHAGFNHGFNCAESVNFATKKWIPIGARAGTCRCNKDAVHIDMRLFRHLVPSSQLPDALLVDTSDEEDTDEEDADSDMEEDVESDSSGAADASCSDDSTTDMVPHHHRNHGHHHSHHRAASPTSGRKRKAASTRAPAGTQATKRARISMLHAHMARSTAAVAGAVKGGKQGAKGAPAAKAADPYARPHLTPATTSPPARTMLLKEGVHTRAAMAHGRLGVRERVLLRLGQERAAQPAPRRRAREASAGTAARAIAEPPAPSAARRAPRRAARAAKPEDVLQQSLEVPQQPQQEAVQLQAEVQPELQGPSSVDEDASNQTGSTMPASAGPDKAQPASQSGRRMGRPVAVEEGGGTGSAGALSLGSRLLQLLRLQGKVPLPAIMPAASPAAEGAQSPARPKRSNAGVNKWRQMDGEFDAEAASDEEQPPVPSKAAAPTAMVTRRSAAAAAAAGAGASPLPQAGPKAGLRSSSRGAAGGAPSTPTPAGAAPGRPATRRSAGTAAAAAAAAVTPLATTRTGGSVEPASGKRQVKPTWKLLQDHPVFLSDDEEEQVEVQEESV